MPLKENEYAVFPGHGMNDVIDGESFATKELAIEKAETSKYFDAGDDFCIAKLETPEWALPSGADVLDFALGYMLPVAPDEYPPPLGEEKIEELRVAFKEFWLGFVKKNVALEPSWFAFSDIKTYRISRDTLKAVLVPDEE